MGIILQVKNLTKRFGGLTAVNDVSFDIERGSLVGLIGLSLGWFLLWLGEKKTPTKK